MEYFTIEPLYFPGVEFANAMNAVAHKETTRKIMAIFYADCLACIPENGVDCIDWKTLNGAITKRWPRGLDYIKEQAWKLRKRKTPK